MQSAELHLILATKMTLHYGHKRRFSPKSDITLKLLKKILFKNLKTDYQSRSFLRLCFFSKSAKIAPYSIIKSAKFALLQFSESALFALCY